MRSNGRVSTTIAVLTMQSSLCCAACATPLRPDAAGHGHYRMKNASVGAVAACSRPCGAIGLMLAAIGAPPTKRTAGDADLPANEPKVGRLNFPLEGIFTSDGEKWMPHPSKQLRNITDRAEKLRILTSTERRVFAAGTLVYHGGSLDNWRDGVCCFFVSLDERAASQYGTKVSNFRLKRDIVLYYWYDDTLAFQWGVDFDPSRYETWNAVMDDLAEKAGPTSGSYNMHQLMTELGLDGRWHEEDEELGLTPNAYDALELIDDPDTDFGLWLVANGKSWVIPHASLDWTVQRLKLNILKRMGTRAPRTKKFNIYVSGIASGALSPPDRTLRSFVGVHEKQMFTAQFTDETEFTLDSLHSIHSRSAYQPVGARVDVDDLQLATVGNGVFLAPSTIVSASTGESIGLGLFAGRDFHPNQPITQYYGHIFKDSARPEDRLEHAIEAVGGWVIDATRTEDNVLITDPAAQLSRLKAGGAGYANDLDFPRVTGMDIKSVQTPEGAITNAVFRRIMDQNVKARVDRGEPIGKDEFAIFLEATTHIPSGSEIFVSYNLAAYITPKSKAEPLPSSSNQRDGSRRKQSAPKRR